MPKTEFYSPEDIKRMSGWGGMTTEQTQDIVKQYEQKRLEPLSGKETAEIISNLYGITGPKVGCRLVEANVVLAVAGLKSLADISWLQLDESEQEQLKNADKTAKQYGITFFYNPTVDQLAIGSLKGLERKTKTTKIPGVPIFDSRQQFEGFARWLKSFDSSLESAKAAGLLSTETNLEIIYEGIRLGYPDQAILDFEEWLRSNSDYSNLDTSNILSGDPNALKLSSNVCEFDFYPQHADDPGIVEYVKTARKILEEFYQSKWFQKLKCDQSFLEARKAAEAIARAGQKEKKERWREQQTE